MTSNLTRLVGLAIVMAGVFGVSLSIGSSGIPISDVITALTSTESSTVRTIVLDLRLPRTVLAALVGGALALAGATFQALLRNPLAEPYVLGISGGAAVGAVSVVVTGWNMSLLAGPAVGALLGAGTAMALVLYIAHLAGNARMDPRVLILAGVIVSAFFNAIIILLLSIADVESFRSAIFWMMGNLSAATWASDLFLAVTVVVCATTLLAFARPLNLLAAGDDVAFYLGVPIQRIRILAYVVASTLVGASVAVSGVIGFVGLIVPHAVRLAWGNDHRLLLPASILVGAAFLITTDMISRVIIAPAELPTGVMTAMLGVPLFIVLLVRSQKRVA